MPFASMRVCIGEAASSRVVTGFWRDCLQPNVVILGYGMANSFDGEKGLPSFKADMSRLMDTISSLNTNQPVRFVLLSPIHHEDVDGALPDTAPHNKQLARYTQALRELAAARKCPLAAAEPLAWAFTSAPRNASMME